MLYLYSANRKQQNTSFMGTLKGVMHSGRPNKTSTVYTRTNEKKYDRQNVYASLRGYMIGKGMADVQDDGSVKIVVGAYCATVTIE